LSDIEGKFAMNSDDIDVLWDYICLDLDQGNLRTIALDNPTKCGQKLIDKVSHIVKLSAWIYEVPLDGIEFDQIQNNKILTLLRVVRSEENNFGKHSFFENDRIFELCHEAYDYITYSYTENSSNADKIILGCCAILRKYCSVKIIVGMGLHSKLENFNITDSLTRDENRQILPNGIIKTLFFFSKNTRLKRTAEKLEERLKAERRITELEVKVEAHKTERENYIELIKRIAKKKQNDRGEL